jgi:hypothetical protein
VAINVSAGTNFKPAPAGLHQAVCCDVVDIGLVEVQTPQGAKMQHKVSVVWQIGEVDPETNKRFIVSRRYTASINEKASLHKDLVAWRGKAFTADELKAFDLEKLIGANCQLQVVHQEVAGKGTYANVNGILPLGKGMEKMTVADGYIRKKDRPVEQQAPTGQQAPTAATPQAPAEEDLPF